MEQLARDRTDDSVQFSLAELRTIETVRLEHEAAERARREREAIELRAEAERRRVEAERLAEERRLAAEREHERALLAERMRVEAAERQAHIDAETQLEARRLDLESRRVEAELAGRKATIRPRLGALTWVLAAGLIAAVAALVWTSRAGARQHAAIEASVNEMAERAGAAERRVAELDRALAELAARPAVSLPEPPAEPPVTAPPTGKKKPPKKTTGTTTPPATGPIILSKECITSPNGCER